MDVEIPDQVWWGRLVHPRWDWHPATFPAVTCEWSGFPLQWKCALLLFQISLCPKEFSAYLVEKRNFDFFLIFQEAQMLSSLFQKLLISADIVEITSRRFNFIASYSCSLKYNRS